MSNRKWDVAEVSVWTVGQFIQKSPFSSFMTILALWTLYSLRLCFHTRQRRSLGIKSSSAVFSPSSQEQHPSFPTCDLTLIYNLSCFFASWGLERYPCSIISNCYGYACLFALLRMIYYCLCSVLICKPPLSNRLGLTQLFTIKQWEMLSTECESLGLSLVAGKLRIDWPSGS